MFSQASGILSLSPGWPRERQSLPGQQGPGSQRIGDNMVHTHTEMYALFLEEFLFLGSDTYPNRRSTKWIFPECGEI